MKLYEIGSPLLIGAVVYSVWRARRTLFQGLAGASVEEVPEHSKRHEIIHDGAHKSRNKLGRGLPENVRKVV